MRRCRCAHSRASCSPNWAPTAWLGPRRGFWQHATEEQHQGTPPQQASTLAGIEPLCAHLSVANPVHQGVQVLHGTPLGEPAEVGVSRQRVRNLGEKVHCGPELQSRRMEHGTKARS